jgi:hypothetical protein
MEACKYDQGGSKFYLMKATHVIQRDQSEAVNWLIGHYAVTDGASPHLT